MGSVSSSGLRRRDSRWSRATGAVGLCAAVVLAVVSCDSGGGSVSPPSAGGGTQVVSTNFTPDDVEVGDPSVSYANVEVTADGAYLVWFEASGDAAGTGIMWHCGIDPLTGDLVPADGKGFRAFDSTLLGRANPGRDRDGVYYVGLDRDGHLVRVRPTGPTSGTVEVLDAPADNNRRSIYPTNTPEQPGGLVSWIANENVAGSGADPRNAWVELREAPLDDLADVHVVARQDRPARGMAPLDVSFVRWIQGTHELTYGALDSAGHDQVAEYDADRPDAGSVTVTDDTHVKIDPYGLRFQGTDYLLAGWDATARSGIYVRGDGEATFHLLKALDPPPSALTTPGLAQSHEPIVWADTLYSAYQINDRTGNFFTTAFSSPGEIWLTPITGAASAPWRISGDETLVRAEPEPFIGTDQVWVFYSAADPASVSGVTTTTWQLRRATTPLVTR
jgi:hypothetical protein